MYWLCESHAYIDLLIRQARYYVDEVKDKNGEDIDLSSWEQEYVEDLPEQENGYVYFLLSLFLFCCPSESLHKGIHFLFVNLLQ